MNGVLPLPVIPQAWAEKGCCPICQAAKLRVQHTPNEPDQMVCGQCGAAFQLEMGGSRLCLTKAPPALGPRSAAVIQAWLSVADLRTLLQGPPPPPVETASRANDKPAPGERLPAAQQQEAPMAPKTAPAADVSQPQTPTPAPVPSPLLACDETELLDRARGLLALNNSPLQIQVALVQSGVAPEQVQAVMETIRQLAIQKHERQVQSAWRMTAILGVLLALMVGAGVLFSFRSRLFPPSVTSATATAATAVPTQKPTPTGVAGFLMSLPTVAVQAGPTPASGSASTPGPCPGSPQEAATLFGGQASEWSYKPDAGGWVMTSLTAKTVNVPAGMMAGYVQFGEGGANMNQVDGPATLKGVNFVAIACQ